jgi:predicted dinucleotide-binding enzyme
MSISIIGAGNVGMALGQALAHQGKRIIFGVTEPGKYQQAVEKIGSGVSLTNTQQAIIASEVVMLAVPYAAVSLVAQSVPDWQGKILVDATNPLAPGLSGLLLGTTTSGAEELAKVARGARVVKAFNTTGAENLADTRYPDGMPLMPVCSDDADARERIMALAALIGFDPVDMGLLSSARYLEPFAMTWIHLAIKQGRGRKFAFARLMRD